MKLHLVDDWHYLVSRRMGPHLLPRPKGWDLVVFIGGKLLFLGLAFGLPGYLHPWWKVLFFYVVTASVLGMVMVLVFVVPHLVGEAEFPVPEGASGRIPTPWAVHQALVTLDFARNDAVLTLLLGGLNFHKEHHLFPPICHVNYPGIAPIVEEVCREFGVPYKEHRTLGAGLAAHYRWLRRMGTAD